MPVPALARAARLSAALTLVVCLLCPVLAVAADPVFPELTGRIVDNADLLSADDEQRIEAELQALEAASTDQLAVVTLPSLQGFTIEEFGYKLGRHWGIGQAGVDNGVLLLVAPNERKVRIEVGKRLEPVLTDALSKLIITNAILPAFRRGDFAAGIEAGVRDIKDVLLGDVEAVKRRAAGGRPAQGPDWIGLLIIAIWITIVLYLMWVQAREAGKYPNTLDEYGRPRRRGGRRVIIVPGGSGGWSGGGGGRGWSGGGGTFSGGGASGSW